MNIHIDIEVLQVIAFAFIGWALGMIILKLLGFALRAAWQPYENWLDRHNEAHNRKAALEWARHDQAWEDR